MCELFALNSRQPAAATFSLSGVSSGGAHYNPSLHQEGAVGRYLTVGLSYRF